MSSGSVVLASMCALFLLGCGEREARYGESSLTSSAPRLTLSGTTFGETMALELAPGCPGFLDVNVPAHVVQTAEDLSFRIQARSDEGPLALAVAHEDMVRCDSDGGTGHAPALELSGSGRFEIFVAALEAPRELGYELTVESGGAGTAAPIERAGAADSVSVTITSEPVGARITDATGREIGTTPAMFVMPRPTQGSAAEVAWTLRLPDHAPTTVTSTLTDPAVLLHGHLTPQVSGPIVVSNEQPMPIRDFQSAALAVNVAEQRSITNASVRVRARHSYIGDLRVVLRTPWQQELVLQRHVGGARRGLARTWATRSDEGSVLQPLRGRSTAGRWTLVVHDDAGEDEGTLNAFELRLSCGDEDEDPGGAEAPTRPRARRNPSGRGMAALPNRTEIVRVMGGLRPRAEACGRGGGTVRVMATVRGATGRVSSVRHNGTASSAERACVARIVRSARFTPFRRNALDIDYTYDLPRRSPP